MGAFVLVTTSEKGSVGPIPASQVFERLMLLLLSEGFWPHRTNEIAGRGLQVGDAVLFCLILNEGPQIVGDAVVASGSVPLTPQRLGQVGMYLGSTTPPDLTAFTHYVVLTQWKILDHPRQCVGGVDPAEDALIEALRPPISTGAVRPLSAEAFQRLTGRIVPEVTPPPSAEMPASPRPACDMKAFLLANWALVDFGEPLRPLPEVLASENGEPALGGIDLVCENTRSGDLVAIVWANGDAPAEALARARVQVARLADSPLAAKRKVRGLVLTSGPGAKPQSTDTLGAQLPIGGDTSCHDPSARETDPCHVELRRVRVYCEPIAVSPAHRSPPSLVPAAAEPSQPEGFRSPFGPSADSNFAAKCLRVPRAGKLR